MFELYDASRSMVDIKRLREELMEVRYTKTLSGLSKWLKSRRLRKEISSKKEDVKTHLLSFLKTRILPEIVEEGISDVNTYPAGDYGARADVRTDGEEYRILIAAGEENLFFSKRHLSEGKQVDAVIGHYVPDPDGLTRFKLRKL